MSNKKPGKGKKINKQSTKPNIDPKWNEDDLKNHDGASAVIINDDAKVLVLDSVKHGKLSLPGGKRDDYESIEDALKRECFEELGIMIGEYKPMVDFKGVYQRNEKEVIAHVHIFAIKNYSLEVYNKEPEKHKQLLWLSEEEIKNYPQERLCDTVKEFVKFMDSL